MVPVPEAFAVVTRSNRIPIQYHPPIRVISFHIRFMLIPVDLAEFEIIAAPKLGAAPSGPVVPTMTERSPRQMLMCHKVVNKNLIDSSPLFRIFYFPKRRNNVDEEVKKSYNFSQIGG